MTTVISVHSFRGGTGKSNTTSNLAAQLAAAGNRVAVVDTDIQSPGIHVLFGFSDDLDNTLNDYLWGKLPIKDTAHDVTGIVAANTPIAQGGALYLVPSSMKAGDIARVLREGYDVGTLNDGFRDLAKELQLDDAQKQRLGVVFDKVREQRTALIGSTVNPRAEIGTSLALPSALRCAPTSGRERLTQHRFA